MKKNQGFTLVELLVSIAVMSIVMTAIVGLMNAASRYYANSNREVEVQNMLQSTFTQVSNMVIDANISVVYDDANKRATVVNSENYYMIQLDDDKLYVEEGNYANAFLTPNAKIEKAKAATITKNDNNVLADHVETFKLDTTNLSTNGYVVLAVRITYGSRSAYLSQNVFVRNNGNVKNDLIYKFKITYDVQNKNVNVHVLNQSGGDFEVGTTFKMYFQITGSAVGTDKINASGNRFTLDEAETDMKKGILCVTFIKKDNSKWGDGDTESFKLSQFVGEIDGLKLIDIR